MFSSKVYVLISLYLSLLCGQPDSEGSLFLLTIIRLSRRAEAKNNFGRLIFLGRFWVVHVIAFSGIEKRVTINLLPSLLGLFCYFYCTLGDILSV